MRSRHCEKIKVIGGMIPNPLPPVREVCKNRLHTNLGDPESYENLKEQIDYLVKRVSQASLGKEYPGWVTSGATESNILSLYYWRSQGKKRVVLFDSAHYSILKAAKILNMETLIIPTENGYKPKLEILRNKITEKDIITATVGTTETGFIDPIEAIYEIAKRKNAGLHVDAAFTGYIMRYLNKPVKITLDETLSTIAIDVHKIPEAPIPVGVLLANSEELIEALFFESPYIPGKKQFGLLGSRPGCSVYAAHIALDLLHLIFGNVENLARELLNYAESVANELEAFGYKNVHEIYSPIVCLQHPEFEKIIEKAEMKCVKLYTCPRFKGFRLAIMPHIIWNNDIEIKHLLVELAKGG